MKKILFLVVIFSSSIIFSQNKGKEYTIRTVAFYNLENLFDTINAKATGPVISENNIRYKRPVTFPDTLSVGITISDIKSDRFVMNYSVFSHAQNAITTTGMSKVVMFDFKTGQKATITEPLLSALKANSQTE